MRTPFEVLGGDREYRDPSLRRPIRLGESACLVQDDRALLFCELDRLFLGELAAMAAVEDIDEQAEGQPDDEAQPCDQGEPEHQATAQQN